MGFPGGLLPPKERTSGRISDENFTKRLVKRNFQAYNLKLGCYPLTSKFFRRPSTKINQNAKLHGLLTALLMLSDV
jgi:hypothetical protein